MSSMPEQVAISVKSPYEQQLSRPQTPITRSPSPVVTLTDPFAKPITSTTFNAGGATAPHLEGFSPVSPRKNRKSCRKSRKHRKNSRKNNRKNNRR